MFLLINVISNFYWFDSRLIYSDTHPNGGATVLYLLQKDVDMLSPHQQTALAEEFLKVNFITGFFYCTYCTFILIEF